jgi:response regulator of citrate/malate metabolism
MQTAPTGYAAQVAVKVEKAITAAGFTVTAISAATGISRETLRRRLAGSPFTVAELASIAHVIKAQPGDLVPPLTETAA